MADGLVLTTENVPARRRREWLREVIGREYAKVEIAPPVETPLFNEMTIYPWNELRLSSIRSNAIGIERPRREPTTTSQDVYLAVLLLSGDYVLEQDGREVALRPGQMTIYDATRPHRISCPGRFSKLLVSIPRETLRRRVVGAEQCSAATLSATGGVGAVASAFLRACAAQASDMDAQQFAALSDHCLDLLCLALNAARAAPASRSRSASAARIKTFVERNLRDPELDPAMVAAALRLSPRYVNDVLTGEGSSLMRYVWTRWLENCRRELGSPAGAGRSLTDIAFSWGFNDLSHFSRCFKQSFGCAPRDYRRSALLAGGERRSRPLE